MLSFLVEDVLEMVKWFYFYFCIYFNEQDGTSHMRCDTSNSVLVYLRNICAPNNLTA